MEPYLREFLGFAGGADRITLHEEDDHRPPFSPVVTLDIVLYRDTANTAAPRTPEALDAVSRGAQDCFDLEDSPFDFGYCTLTNASTPDFSHGDFFHGFERARVPSGLARRPSRALTRASQARGLPLFREWKAPHELPP